jgi:branched-chain amino acid transport system permease protein
MRHWMGPAVGAVIIYTLTDRLNSAGLEDVNQVIIGGLLIILVLAVREGIFLRLLDRWKLALTTFVLAMAVWTIFDLATSLIWDFAYSSLLTLVAILLPRNLPRRRAGTAGEAAPQPSEAIDRSPP